MNQKGLDTPTVQPFHEGPVQRSKRAPLGTPALPPPCSLWSSHGEELAPRGGRHIGLMLQNIVSVIYNRYCGSKDRCNPAGVSQEEGHTGFIIHRISAVHVLYFSREGFSRSFPSSIVKSNTMYQRINRSPLVRAFFFFFFLVSKNPSYRDSNSRPNVLEG